MSSTLGDFKVEFGRTGSIVSASIRTYLLERSRIVRVQPGERNYHVFYDIFHLEKELLEVQCSAFFAERS
jgi:myosin heavy subunit